MYQKVIITSLYFKLLMMSALLQLIIAVSNQKISQNRIEQLFRKKSILEKILKSSRANENPWLEKRTPSYTDPCKSQTKEVSVKELDDGNEGTLYIPATLRVRTCIQGNSISPRGNPLCQGFSGDCRNLVSTIEVLKLTPNSQLPLTVTITYNVGCACMIVD